MSINTSIIRLNRELDLIKTETIMEPGEGKLLSRIMRRLNLEIGRLRNIAATRTLSTEERVCKLVDAHIKELTELHHQRTDAAYYQGKLGGKGTAYILDLKGDREIREKIQQTVPKMEQLLFLLRAKSTLAGENKIAALRKNLQALSSQNEAVLKEHYQRFPETAPKEKSREKIPPLERDRKRKAASAAVSSRLPRKAEMQEIRREKHRQAKQYIATNLPVLIQLALDKGGKGFKKNLKARGVNLESLLATDFSKMRSAQLYKMAKSIIIEISEAHPQNDQAFQVVRDLVAEFDRRLFKEGAYR